MPKLDRRKFLTGSVAGAAGAGASTGSVLSKESSEESRLLFQREIPVRHEVDVFVAGGGPAGVAASVSAARQGARVFLAERNTSLGGMGTAGMLPVFMPFGDGVNFLAAGIGEEILSQLRRSGGAGPGNGLSGAVMIQAEVLKRVYDDLLLEAGVQFSFRTDLIAVETEKNSVTHALLAAKSGLFAVKARVFIDGTGDGDLAAWAGASFEKGDENGNLMAGTLCSLWAGIDWDEVKRGGRRRDDSRLPEAFQDGVFTVEDRHLPGMFDLSGQMGGGNIGHTFGLDSTDERSITRALIGARKSLLEYEEYYKEYLRGFEEMELVGTASQLGCRESRRIMGDYVLNLEDFKRRAVFDDEIGRYAYAVDLHAAQADKASYEKFEKDFKNLRYGKGESYGIPYRVLLPKELSNVLVAGRCVSSDRSIQSSIRVMPGCFITGQAAGVAAALAVEKQTDTRGFPVSELRERLKAAGAFLPNA